MDEKIQDETIQKEIQKLKEILKILNFSEEDINKQLAQLEILISLSVTAEILKIKGFQLTDSEISKEEAEIILKEKTSPEEVREIGKEISSKFLSDYFDAITENITEEQIKKIQEILSS
jgi:hypothetical protein